MANLPNCLASAAVLAFQSAFPASAFAHPGQASPGAIAAAVPGPQRDGSHDFDFAIGTWKMHFIERAFPLTDNPTKVELNGRVSVQKIWGGSAQWHEIEAESSGGGNVLEAMTFFLYDPAAHQWNVTLINSNEGSFGNGLTGSFENGRGEFYGQAKIGGRTVLVRGIWSKITPTSSQLRTILFARRRKQLADPAQLRSHHGALIDQVFLPAVAVARIGFSFAR